MVKEILFLAVSQRDMNALFEVIEEYPLPCAIIAGILCIYSICYQIHQSLQRKRAKAELNDKHSYIRQQYNKWIQNIAGGNLPKLPESRIPFSLLEDEAGFYKCNSDLYELRAVRSHSNVGGSFRVARGVYLHKGAGQSRSRDEWARISNGSFIVTNKRIVYQGDNASRIIEMKKLIGVTVNTPDQVIINSSSRQKSMVFTVGNAYMVETIINSILSAKANEPSSSAKKKRRKKDVKKELVVTCPHCHSEYKIESHEVGNTAECINCGTSFVCQPE